MALEPTAETVVGWARVQRPCGHWEDLNGDVSRNDVLPALTDQLFSVSV